MTGVVIVRERCASKDPPDDDRAVWTNVGPLSFTDEHSDFTPSRRYKRLWVHTLGGMPVTPQPSVWFDFPRDMEREALTEEDLRDIRDAAVIGVNEMGGYPGELPMYVARTARATERLRAALDALDKGGR